MPLKPYVLRRRAAYSTSSAWSRASRPRHKLGLMYALIASHPLAPGIEISTASLSPRRPALKMALLHRHERRHAVTGLLNRSALGISAMGRGGASACGAGGALASAEPAGGGYSIVTLASIFNRPGNAGIHAALVGRYFKAGAMSHSRRHQHRPGRPALFRRSVAAEEAP